jgi:hypothetical protein
LLSHLADEKKCERPSKTMQALSDDETALQGLQVCARARIIGLNAAPPGKLMQ